jgi:hypothetical protein
MVPAIAPSAEFIRPNQYGRLLADGSVFSATLKTTLKGLSKSASVGTVTLIAPPMPRSQEDPRDQSARRNAKDLLDELEELQRDVLGGGEASARLPRIANLAAALTPADPELGEICRAIVTRARVEMARLQYALNHREPGKKRRRV